MPLTVEILLFSGLADPAFTLDDGRALEFAARVGPAMEAVPVPAQWATPFGYRGFGLEGGEAVGLPPRLEIGQGLVIAETDAGRTAWVDAGGCEEWLKQRARDAGLGALLDDDGGAPGPRPRSTALRQGLVADALGYASDRLDELVDTVLRDVPSFAAAANAVGFVDDGSVAGHLAAARSELGLLVVDLDAANLLGAATHLGAALRALDLAAVTVGGLRLGPLLAGSVAWGAVVPTGLAAQLGLPAVAPGRIDVDGAAFVFELKAPGASLVPAGILRFDAATLSARLSLDAAVPGFAITLALNGLEAGVGGRADRQLCSAARPGRSAADIVVGVDLEQRADPVRRRGQARGAAGARRRPARSTSARSPIELPGDRHDTIDVGTTLTVRPRRRHHGDGRRGGPARSTSTPARSPAATRRCRSALKPPTGIGLTLDTGLVRGGGFLGVRPGGYGGALQLRLGPVEVKAVGLLTLEPELRAGRRDVGRVHSRRST